MQSIGSLIRKIYLGTHTFMFTCNHVYNFRQFTDALKHFQEFYIKDPCPVDFVQFFIQHIIFE